MLELEMNYEPGHHCQAMVISLSGGLDVVLIDVVDDDFEPSLFHVEKWIKQACEELLNDELHGLNPKICSWYIADLTREHYGICGFAIDVEEHLGSRTVHFRRWRECPPDRAHELFDHLQMMQERRVLA